MVKCRDYRFQKSLTHSHFCILPRNKQNLRRGIFLSSFHGSGRCIDRKFCWTNWGSSEDILSWTKSCNSCQKSFKAGYSRPLLTTLRGRQILSILQQPNLPINNVAHFITFPTVTLVQDLTAMNNSARLEAHRLF